MAAFSIAYGRTKEHARQLRAGLLRLPQDFTAKICTACDGEGQYEQMYTAGCGQGYYRSMGGCDWCDGTGLMQGTRAAPDSVREQVLNAAVS